MTLEIDIALIASLSAVLLLLIGLLDWLRKWRKGDKELLLMHNNPDAFGFGSRLMSRDMKRMLSLQLILLGEQSPAWAKDILDDDQDPALKADQEYAELKAVVKRQRGLV